MSSLVQRIAKHYPEGVHTILVVGAANGGDLQNWRRLGSRHLVLTEAHPDLAAELSRRIDGARNEEVWPLAVTPSQRDGALLYVCNNPRYSSLRRAQELGIYFPSLKVTGEIRVAARAFHEAIKQSGATEAAPNLLVLAAPGQSLDLIRSTPPEQLQAFEWIIVHASSVPLYEGDDAEACLTSLRAAGYENVQEDPDAIHPDRAVLLRRDDTRVRVGQLESRLKQLAEEHARLLAQHKTELDKVAAELAGEKKRAAEQHTQIQKLIQERDAQAKLANDRKAELDNAAAALAGEKKLAADRYTQIQTLTQGRDSQTQAITQLKSELDRANQQIVELKQSLSDREGLLKKVSLQNQERGARIVALDKQLMELKQRQAWLDEEMTKAEAQVEFIKDIFLRDRA
jgi:hypothetical protein